MLTINTKDLIGRTFLMVYKEDGQRFRACVVRAVVDKEEELNKGLEYMKFICDVPNSTVDEIHTCNPLWTSNKDYKGSIYNLLVELETGQTTYEPLEPLAQDDPVTCADYAKHNKILDTAG
jgi:hypothetical protein